MENTTTISDRLRAFIKHKRISVREFERNCGLSNGYVKGIVDTIGTDKLENITTAYNDINPMWVMTGKGQMIREQQFSGVSSPYFDTITIEGGRGIGDGTEACLSSEPSGQVVLPGMPIGSDTPYIRVHGRSMINHKDPENSIPSGALIAVQPANFTSVDTIRWGEVYAFMTNDGPVVKKVVPSEVDGCIKCISFNEEEHYYPYNQPLEEIIGGLYYVVGVVYAKRWK